MFMEKNKNKNMAAYSWFSFPYTLFTLFISQTRAVFLTLDLANLLLEIYKFCW